MRYTILALLTLFFCTPFCCDAGDITLQPKSVVRISLDQDGTFHVSCENPESYREFWLGWLSNFSDERRAELMTSSPFDGWMAEYQPVLRCDARVFQIIAPKLVDHLLSRGYAVTTRQEDLRFLGH